MSKHLRAPSRPGANANSRTSKTALQVGGFGRRRAAEEQIRVWSNQDEGLLGSVCGRESMPPTRTTWGRPPRENSTMSKHLRAPSRPGANAAGGLVDVCRARLAEESGAGAGGRALLDGERGGAANAYDLGPPPAGELDHVKTPPRAVEARRKRKLQDFGGAQAGWWTCAGRGWLKRAERELADAHCSTASEAAEPALWKLSPSLPSAIVAPSRRSNASFSLTANHRGEVG
jgi:hypothetical protein